MAVIIFTDLDASLLDHEGYGFAGAAEALEWIRRDRIPLIAVTSKCRPEVEAVRMQLGIRDPFIVESGAALYVPEGYRRLRVSDALPEEGYRVFRWGMPYRLVRDALAAARQRFPVRGFGDMDAAEVMRRTGLPLDQAILARQREHSEPFILADPSRLRDLENWAAARDLAIVRGGRFFHLIAAAQSKGRAVTHLIGLFRQILDKPPVTIGIGDSPNDASMLAVVDLPVLLPHDDGTLAQVPLAGLIRGRAPGSRGWNQVVLRLLAANVFTAIASP
jgi:mannosyl-3-phosphoglycerate phosphatase